MHLICTLACKSAHNFDAMLIYDSLVFYPFVSFYFIYGDHACISSILQSVSLLKILTNVDFMTSFYSSVSYTVTSTIHASHLYSSL